MTKPRNFQTEAVIIKKTKLGEADRILTLYTPYLGKIQAVAKGVRRPKSKMSGHLELLTHSLISLARGRNIDTVTNVQTINSFIMLKSDLWLASCALYVAELVELFTAEGVENYPLFQLLIETMHRLCRDNDNDITLRYFEMQLLNTAGYRPQLQQCMSCHSELIPTVNFFSPGAGGMLCPDCRHLQSSSYSLSINAQKILRLMQKYDYETSSRLKIDANLSHEVQQVIRAYLKYLLEREIKSSAWVDILKVQLKKKY